MAIALRAAAGSSEGTDTSAEVLIPSGTTQDDIIIAVVSAAASSQPGAFSWPGGWTVLNNQGGLDGGLSIGTRIEVAWKKFNTGDGTQTVTVGTLTQGGWVASSVSYSGVDLTTPVVENAIGSWTSTASSSALATPTATSSTPNVWRASAFSSYRFSAENTWGSYTAGNTERDDNACTSAARRTVHAYADSDGTVDASSGTSVSATPSASVAGRVAWIGLLAPAAPPDAFPEAVSTTATSNDPKADVKPSSDTATTTAMVNAPAASAATGSGAATAATTAYSASVVTTANADSASTTASAHDATRPIGAEAVTASAVAHPPEPSLDVPSGTATASATSTDATNALSTTPDVAVATTTAESVLFSAPSTDQLVTTYGPTVSITFDGVGEVAVTTAASSPTPSPGGLGGEVTGTSATYGLSSEIAFGAGTVNASSVAGDPDASLTIEAEEVSASASALDTSDHIDVNAEAVEVAISGHAPSMGLTPDLATASAEAMGVGTGLTPTEVTASATAYTVSIHAAIDTDQAGTPQATANDAAIHFGVAAEAVNSAASSPDAVQGVGVLAEETSAEASGFYIPFAGYASASVSAFNITSQQNVVPPTRQVKILAEVRRTTVEGVRSDGEGLRIVKIPTEVRRTVVS